MKKKIDILSNVYWDAQRMITIADNKANISLTIQSLLITIGLGISILSNVFDDLQSLISINLPFVYFYFIILIIFIITSIAGIVSTIYVYKPREQTDDIRTPKKGLLYFGDVSKYNSCDDYYSEISIMSEDDLLKEYTRQIFDLSGVLKNKFKCVNYSIYFLILNTGITIFFLVLSGIVHISA